MTGTVPLNNHARGLDAFFIRGADIREARAAAAPDAVIGRYHTHPPHCASPSRQDRASLPAGWIELIVTVTVYPRTPDEQVPGIAGLFAYHEGRALDVVT